MKKFLLALLLVLVSLPGYANVDKGIVLNFNTTNPLPVISTVSGVPISCGIEFGGHCLTGNDSGQGFTWYNAADGTSLDDWSGSPIQWHIVTPFFPNNNPSQAGGLKKFVVICHGAYQQFSARAYALTRLGDGTMKWQPNDGIQKQSFPPSQSDLSTWRFGNSTTEQEQMIDIPSRGNGRFWALHLYGTNTGDHIDAEAVQALQTVGGLQ